MTVSDKDHFNLRYDEHEQSRAASLQALWENRDFLDVTIACDDDQIEAHKVVLSAASPFFQNILKRNLHNHPLLYIRGTTKKRVEALLKFIYSGETNVAQEDLEEFMNLARSLQVQGLNTTEDEMEEEEAAAKEEVPIVQVEMKNKPAGAKAAKNRKQNRRVMKIEINAPINYVENVSDFTEEGAHDIVKNYLEPETPKMKSVSQSADLILNTSLSEYEEQRESLIIKTESGNWKCQECPYEKKPLGHVREHVEKHIKGFALRCDLCDQTFSYKRMIRVHKRKVHSLE